MKYIRALGTILGITALVLAWIWFGWKLSIVIFLALWANNMEQKKGG